MIDFTDYHRRHAARPPRKQLLRAVDFCETRCSALDLGAGTLMESAYLLDAGFARVVATDAVFSDATRAFAATLGTDRLTLVEQSFTKLDLADDSYDLVCAEYSLPFYGQQDFLTFMGQVLGSVKVGGIFTGQLFGVDDEWNDRTGGIAFHTQHEVEAFFADAFELVEFREVNDDRHTSDGKAKHWHRYEIIARKIRHTEWI